MPLPLMSAYNSEAHLQLPAPAHSRPKSRAASVAGLIETPLEEGCRRHERGHR